MAWYCQATTHYLSKCWPRSICQHMASLGHNMLIPSITNAWWDMPHVHIMVTSSNGNIFRVTGPLSKEFTGYRWIPNTKASDAEFDVFFDLHLNKRLSKQSWGWWFDAHYDAIVMITLQGQGNTYIFDFWSSLDKYYTNTMTLMHNWIRIISEPLLTFRSTCIIIMSLSNIL